MLTCLLFYPSGESPWPLFSRPCPCGASPFCHPSPCEAILWGTFPDGATPLAWSPSCHQVHPSRTFSWAPLTFCLFYHQAHPSRTSSWARHPSWPPSTLLALSPWAARNVPWHFLRGLASPPERPNV